MGEFKINGIKLPTVFSYGIDYCYPLKREKEIKNYIINENATIIFWNDGDKTISKREKEDTFDKELGFLFAYFYKNHNLGSKNNMKKFLSYLKQENIKDYLFMFFKKTESKTTEQAKKYLKNLNVEVERL